jgi:hypothetical protein
MLLFCGKNQHTIVMKSSYNLFENDFFMKTTLKTLIWFSIILTMMSFMLVQIGFGQEMRSWMKPFGSLEKVKNGKFSSVEAGFSIDLPKNIGGFDGRSGVLYSWRLDEGFFVVGTNQSTTNIEDSEEFDNESTKIIKQVFDGFQSELFVNRVNASKALIKNIEVLGHKGIEATIEMPKGLCVIRVFWVKNRAFKIGLLLFENQLKFKSMALSIFETMKIASDSDADSVIKQKVENATPKPLPQSPVVAKAKSDLEDENILGKAKSVSVNSKYIKGPKAGSPLRKNSEDYFNELGAFTKRISYSDTNGLPFQIRVYGYIDGARVEDAGYISYESNPPAMLIVPSPNAPKRDDRYSKRFRYEYDKNKKLKEMTLFSNDGKVWLRYVLNYEGNKLETKTYQANGSLNSRSVEILDVKGNTIESTYFGISKEDWQEKSSYSYDKFDENGNWVKRTQRFFRKLNKIEKEEWVEEEFRTITYY